MENKLDIYCDGGARGNPGPAASAFVVINDKEVFYKRGKYLGKATNNFAEYSAVLMALQWLLEKNRNDINVVIFHLDSELVINQLNGNFKVKNKNLKLMVIKVRELQEKINTKIIYKLIPREKNKLADFLINKILNENINI